MALDDFFLKFSVRNHLSFTLRMSKTILSYLLNFMILKNAICLNVSFFYQIKGKIITNTMCYIIHILMFTTNIFLLEDINSKNP